MKTAITILLTAAIAAAAPCHLRWDRNPEPDITAYRIWRGIDMLKETTETTATVDLPPDQASTLTVTAHIGELASEPSEPITAIPYAPQTSTDLVTWHEPAGAVFFTEATPAVFYRIRYLVPETAPETAPEPSPLSLQFQAGSFTPVPAPVPLPVQPTEPDPFRPTPQP